MAVRIESHKPFLGEVPPWMFLHIGKRVSLRLAMVDGPVTYPRGSVGTLTGIDSSTHEDGTISKYALVVFDDDVTQDLLQVPFSRLDPVNSDDLTPAQLFLNSLDPCTLKVVLAWRNGFDMRSHFSKTTYYRYRNELVKFGVDIGSRPE